MKEKNPITYKPIKNISLFDKYASLILKLTLTCMVLLATISVRADEIFMGQNLHADGFSISPLSFEMRPNPNPTTESYWTGHAISNEINFMTAAVPKLEGPVLTLLGTDKSVKLHFDQPVSKLQAIGDLIFEVEADDNTGQNFLLLTNHYEQGRKYLVQLNFRTITGLPLPSISLELTTPPPLVAKSNIQGLSNLGLMLPLQITFSEPLANRADAASSIRVQIHDGGDITGKWSWNGPRQLKFTPDPAWPASSTIDVSIEGKNLKSVQGGTMEQALTEQFSTGIDRRLFVYLENQRVDAVENGKLVRSFKVSTGKGKTPTVTGSFYIYDRYRRKTMRSDVEPGKPGYYEVKNVPYTQFFHKDYAFHGAFWHNNFGHPASHGCINMATKDQNKHWPKVAEDAGWLYQWGALGLPVTVMQKTPEKLKASLPPNLESKGATKNASPQPDNLTDKKELPHEEAGLSGGL
jgi:lipoprotein-anchoring transpeptidase ErfK/SrfK